MSLHPPPPIPPPQPPQMASSGTTIGWARKSVKAPLVSSLRVRAALVFSLRFRPVQRAPNEVLAIPLYLSLLFTRRLGKAPQPASELWDRIQRPNRVYGTSRHGPRSVSLTVVCETHPLLFSAVRAARECGAGWQEHLPHTQRRGGMYRKPVVLPAVTANGPASSSSRA
ncbi:hypothetical protein DFH09DRAFT_1154115 [Mycena vulgaris]|nr:hypothetical protein DFH09DRAFT_1154115 [Mycena vulgaris]